MAKLLHEKHEKILESVPDGSKVLLFDADGTIYRDSLFLDVFREFVSMGLVDEADMTTVETLRKKWKDREIDYDDFLLRTIDPYEKALAKIPWPEYADICRRVAESRHKNTYRFPMKKAAELRKLGFLTVIISGSPQAAVEKFAEKAGFDYALGTVEMYGDTGEFLNERVLLAIPEAKREIVRILSKKRCKLAGMWDTMGDAPLIFDTGRGFAFNPNADLYDKFVEEAENGRRDVSVVIERKNLVLEIIPNPAAPGEQLTFSVEKHSAHPKANRGGVR